MMCDLETLTQSSILKLPKRLKGDDFPARDGGARTRAAARENARDAGRQPVLRVLFLLVCVCVPRLLVPLSRETTASEKEDFSVSLHCTVTYHTSSHLNLHYSNIRHTVYDTYEY